MSREKAWVRRRFRMALKECLWLHNRARPNDYVAEIAPECLHGRVPWGHNVEYGWNWKVGPMWWLNWWAGFGGDECTPYDYREGKLAYWERQWPIWRIGSMIRGAERLVILLLMADGSCPFRQMLKCTLYCFLWATGTKCQLHYHSWYASTWDYNTNDIIRRGTMKPFPAAQLTQTLWIDSHNDTSR